jgi:hypothetical protein
MNDATNRTEDRRECHGIQKKKDRYQAANLLHTNISSLRVSLGYTACPQMSRRRSGPSPQRSFRGQLSRVMRSELAGYHDRGWSAFLAGTVKRNTPMRVRLCVTRRMTLQGRVKCLNLTRCSGVVPHCNRWPCVREERTFAWRSGYLLRARVALRHPHHALMLPISSAAGRQVGVRIRRRGEERHTQE